MRNIFTFLLLAGVIYFSSCNSGGNSTTKALQVFPSTDTVTKGSYIQLSWTNLSGVTESYYITDLSVNNSPLYEIGSTVTENADSTWASKIILKDFTKKQIALNLSMENPTLTNSGTYSVLNNSSTLTDYSLGQNKTYSISQGSYALYNTVGGTFIQGTLNLNLVYNFQSVNATGSFLIYF